MMTKDENLPLRRIQQWSLIFLALAAGGAALLFGPPAAWAVLVGGGLANGSFWLLKRDLTRLLAGELTGAKARFFIKYYARFSVLALALFMLVKYGSVNIPGLLVGLSVVFFSIAGAAVSAAIKTFKIREAS
jgi:hypothetical protein